MEKQPKIGIVGLGFVGMNLGKVFASYGYDILGVDLIEKEAPFKTSTDYKQLFECDIIFIAVNEGKESINVIEAAKKIHSVNKWALLVIKSTVLPGTATKLSQELNTEIVSNPEFLREAYALQDTTSPSRIIIGAQKIDTANRIKELYKFIDAPVLITTNENAELIKYASNCFLATKISFINEIADLCASVPHSDVNIIAEGMGLDRRIATGHLKAGIGFRGHCLPKDTKALLEFAEKEHKNLKVIKAVVEVNNDRIKKYGE
jgi:UDPglucose 6-dehydrogenase